MKITHNKKSKAYELPLKLTWYDLNMITLALNEALDKTDPQSLELIRKMTKAFQELDLHIKRLPYEL